MVGAGAGASNDRERTNRRHLCLIYTFFVQFSHLPRPLKLILLQPGVEHVPRVAFFSAIAFLRTAFASGLW